MMLVGMQFGIGKLFSTNGPFGLPRLGFMRTSEPIVKLLPNEFELVIRKRPELGLKADPPMPAIATAPTHPGLGGVDVVPWLAQNVPSGLSMGPWWQGMSGPRTFTPPPWPLMPESAVLEGSGQIKPFAPFRP